MGAGSGKQRRTRSAGVLKTDADPIPPMTARERDDGIIEGLKESLTKPILHEYTHKHVHELININKNNIEDFNTIYKLDKKYEAIFDKKFDKFKNTYVGPRADGALDIEDFLRRIREDNPAIVRPRAPGRPLEAELERVEF
jgi:type I site-specific restriction endonuclease